MFLSSSFHGLKVESKVILRDDKGKETRREETRKTQRKQHEEGTGEGIRIKERKGVGKKKGDEEGNGDKEERGKKIIRI